MFLWKLLKGWRCSELLQPRCHLALCCWAGGNLEVCLDRKRRREDERKWQGNRTTKKQWWKKRCWGMKRKREQNRDNRSDVFVYCLFCLWNWPFNIPIFCVSVKWHVHLTKFAFGTHLYIHLSSFLCLSYSPSSTSTHFLSDSLCCIIEITIILLLLQFSVCTVLVIYQH